MKPLSFNSLESLALMAPQYRAIRAQYPNEPAHKVIDYVRHAEHENYEQFHCRHRWNSPEEWERCHCLLCGLDGDA